jgi:hypothetical protein
LKKKNIIEINYFGQLKPIPDTWYKYYNDYFISVICFDRVSYTRKLKSKKNFAKKNDKMCFWHSNWQYDKIENKYGITTGSTKTNEYEFEFNDEIHRIDSLVKNIGIEFQHSLGVQLKEMNSRYVAQKAQNYIPYLVLDCTYLKLQNFIVDIKNFFVNVKQKLKEKNYAYSENKIWRVLNKWIRTDYFKADNLFIDFEDRIIRFCTKIKHNYVIYEKDYFLNNLNHLENDLEKLKSEYSIELDTIKKEQEFLELENAKEKERIQKIEKEEYFIKQQEEHEKKVIEYKLLKETNDKNKLNSELYRYFRKCFSNEKLKKHIEKYKDCFFEYNNKSVISGDLLIKSHEYKTKVDDFKIIYKTHNKLIENKINSEKKVLYQYSTIFIKKYDYKGRKTIFCENFDKIIIKEMRFELFDNYLHSTEFPALYIFDNNSVEKKYYYLNVQISEKCWLGLQDYFNDNRNEINSKYRQLQEDIEKLDKYNIKTYAASKDTPIEIQKKYWDFINADKELWNEILAEIYKKSNE